MRAIVTASLLAATIAVCAIPAAAGAEYLVPPGNSAATQYTEALPTAGGPRQVDGAGKSPRRSPAEVLGGDNARRLEEQGPQGREAAEFATDTAPLAAATGTTEDGGAAGGAGGGGGADGGGRLDVGNGAASDVDGSSGVGEVIAQATGSDSSGQLGLLLPLLVIATLLWALAYLWRERRKPTA
jgi:hypothetical protein